MLVSFPENVIQALKQTYETYSKSYIPIENLSLTFCSKNYKFLFVD